jgi:hypothetical protein
MSISHRPLWLTPTGILSITVACHCQILPTLATPTIDHSDVSRVIASCPSCLMVSDLVIPFPPEDLGSSVRDRRFPLGPPSSIGLGSLRTQEAANDGTLAMVPISTLQPRIAALQAIFE